MDFFAEKGKLNLCFMGLKIRKDMSWKKGNCDVTLERIKYKCIYKYCQKDWKLLI